MISYIWIFMWSKIRFFDNFNSILIKAENISIVKLTTVQINSYKNDGYITIENVFKPSEMDLAIHEAQQWQEEFITDLGEFYFWIWSGSFC